MSPSNVNPSSIIIRPNSGTVRRRLVLRNNAEHDLIVKLIPTESESIKPSTPLCRVAKNFVLVVDLEIDSEKAGTWIRRTPAALVGYVHTLQSFNHNSVRHWIESKSRPSHSQKAFTLNVKVTNDGFDALETVIDLPGAASLIEPIPMATSGIDISDTKTAVPMEFDTITSRSFAPRDLTSQRGPNKQQSCWIADYAMSLVASKEEDAASPVPQKPEKAEKRPKNNNNNNVTTVANELRLQSFDVCGPSEYVNPELNATPCGGAA